MVDDTPIPPDNQTAKRQNYCLHLKILHDVSPYENQTVLDWYNSLPEAINDARQLFLVHTSAKGGQLDGTIDFQITNHAGKRIYSALEAFSASSSPSPIARPTDAE